MMTNISGEYAFEFIVDTTSDSVKNGFSVHMKLNEENSICSTENITLKFKSRDDAGDFKQVKPGTKVEFKIVLPERDQVSSIFANNSFPVAV